MTRRACTSSSIEQRALPGAFAKVRPRLGSGALLSGLGSGSLRHVPPGWMRETVGLG